MPNFSKELEKDLAACKPQETDRELLIEIRDLLKELKQSFERYGGTM